MGSIPRRQFLIVGGALLGAPFARVLAQPPQRAVVGFLGSGSVSKNSVVPLLRHSLREAGWIEGKNLTIESRFSVGTHDIQGLASELVRVKVQVIVASNNPAAEAAGRATRSIPIVVLYAIDPVGAGFAQALARPGGNITGVLFADPAFSAKTLQLMKEALPGMRKVGLLYQEGFPGIEPYLAATEAAGREVGVTLHRFPVRRPEDVDAALAAAKKEGVNALRISAGAALNAAESRIRAFVAANKIPDVYSIPTRAESGGFMSYSPKMSDTTMRAAALVDKILKGAKPAELPFEYPTRMELVVNLKTAKQLGITVPKFVLLRADRVIE